MQRPASRFASSLMASPTTWTERSSAPTRLPRLAATRGSGSSTALVWDLATGGLVTLEGPATQKAGGVGFSPDGKRLVCAYRPEDDGPAKDSPRSIRIWDLVRRRAVVSIDRPPYVMSAPAFSPDGRLLAVNVQGPSLESHGEIKVWDAATGHEVFACQYTRGHSVRAAAFSPDGKRLAACGTRGIRIWDLASRESPVTWPSDSDFGYCLAFSPNGKRLAMGGAEGLAELWDTATGQKVQSFEGTSDQSTPWPLFPTVRDWPLGARTAPCASGT